MPEHGQRLVDHAITRADGPHAQIRVVVVDGKSLVEAGEFEEDLPASSKKTWRRIAKHAPVTAETLRVRSSQGQYGAPKLPRPGWAQPSPMPMAMPPCCKDPEGYSSFAPTTPTSGRTACAARADSQEGTSGSTSSFKKTSTSPSAGNSGLNPPARRRASRDTVRLRSQVHGRQQQLGRPAGA